MRQRLISEQNDPEVRRQLDGPWLCPDSVYDFDDKAREMVTKNFANMKITAAESIKMMYRELFPAAYAHYNYYNWWRKSKNPSDHCPLRPQTVNNWKEAFLEKSGLRPEKRRRIGQAGPKRVLKNASDKGNVTVSPTVLATSKVEESVTIMPRNVTEEEVVSEAVKVEMTDDDDGFFIGSKTEVTNDGLIVEELVAEETAVDDAPSKTFVSVETQTNPTVETKLNTQLDEIISHLGEPDESTEEMTPRGVFVTVKQKMFNAKYKRTQLDIADIYDEWEQIKHDDREVYVKATVIYNEEVKGEEN